MRDPQSQCRPREQASNLMHVRVPVRVLTFVAVAVACAGCENGLSNAWWNDFLNPSSVGNFRQNVVMDIQRSISFRDTPVGIVGAEDPKPEDLEAVVEEYVIGPGDTLQIRLLDFVQLNTETEVTPTVDELGYIDLPQIGLMKAEGRTARELQGDIIQKAKAAELYRPEDQPMVTVVVVNPLQRMFNLSGSVLYPGPYRIARPDFRVFEAINLGGGMDDNVKTVWVFRRGMAGKRTTKHRSMVTTAPAETSSPPGEPGPAMPPPPVSPVLMSDLQAAASPPPAAPAKPRISDRPVSMGGAAPSTQEVPSDLIEAVAPPPSVPVTQPGQEPAATAEPESKLPAATTPAPKGTPADLPAYKFVNDAFIEVPPPQTRPGTEPTMAPPGAPPAPTAQPPVDWEALASEAQHRIVRIPADKLRHGDPNYNIVIRHEDWVRVDPGPVGLYYMDGHVNRPGPYALAGEQITLTQAVAAAGGLDQLAWPTRCEIRRRLDADREEITQWDLARILEGKDPDMYLKPNDVVRVGTHAIAPLLATLRNSFRLTYGFGFVYDRNFADVDSFIPQQNPTDRHRVERQQRFQNLFR
ncbi:MAG: polysaccharide biosynthesis/export family protein [Planctomycetes bacterium]|nr:polysaccharide biosynthesis/export family protein [Planctomycetota bacterium]